MLGGLVSNQKY